MAWFCATTASVRVILSAKAIWAASVHAILSTKAVWAAVNDADVAEKERTASIMTRKSRVDMEICCGGGGAADVLGGGAADVLGPFVAVGAGGAGDSVVITGTADDAI